MTDCTLSRIEFPRCRGRRVVADFDGGDISSNGGALLLSAADRRLGLLSGLSHRLVDARQAGKVSGVSGRTPSFSTGGALLAVSLYCSALIPALGTAGAME